jgi:N-carbamoyl-L-amino-acid hydrolase
VSAGAVAADAAASFDAMWSALEQVGRHPGTGGYRRYAWTREDAQLRDWFAGEAAARGMTLTHDRAGNQWAWRGDPDSDGAGLVLGSHLDSVPDGGAFDGPLGVVSAFAALDELTSRDAATRRPVAVANFGDEEGARFGVACAGSRLLTGALDPDRARALSDTDGTSLADALTAAGGDVRALGHDDETVRRIGVFVELHVEQGRGLAGTRHAVAVGSAIRPHGRWRIELPGAANHAGTTRMDDREDALVAAAEVVLAAREAAERHGGVATVGRLQVEPNGVNAVPAHVTAWLDARHRDEAAARAIAADVDRIVRRLGGSLREQSWTGATQFDPELSGEIAAWLDAPVLDTGAGHDAGVLAAAGVPTAMLFVRNPTGVSHSPAEFAERDDCLAGVAALAAVIHRLAG